MIRELETDGVPAPSDIELAEMDARPRRYGFNGATQLLNINGEREGFHRWCGRFVNLGLAYRKEAWQSYYEIFCSHQAEADRIQAEDARDLHDTQQDALGTLW